MFSCTFSKYALHCLFICLFVCFCFSFVCLSVSFVAAVVCLVFLRPAISLCKSLHSQTWEQV